MGRCGFYLRWRMMETPRVKASNDLSGVLALVQELTGKLAHSDSTADLFSHAFPVLFPTLPFDIAVAVMIEQNLDLYVTTRQGVEVNDSMVQVVRRRVRTAVSTSLERADVMVRSEEHDLPARKRPGDPLRREIHAEVRYENRAAGLLIILRDTPEFSRIDRQVLEIFASQLSILLDNLRARRMIVDLDDFDDLTGVANHRYFKRMLSREMERARVYNVPLSLLMIDVDEFKSIIDEHGRAIGDVVLSELCGMIRETLRSPDGISRFSADEFAVILPHTDLSGARAASERILERVRALSVVTQEGSTIRCSVSIGIAQYNSNDRSITDLIRRADDRLYEAKRQGKDRYIF